MRAQFITAEEVEQALGVSRSKAYQIIRALNKELDAMGYITIVGKCPIQYFQQKFYGIQMGLQIVTATGQQGHNSGLARDTIAGQKLSQYPARKGAFLYNGRTSFSEEESIMRRSVYGLQESAHSSFHQWNEQPGDRGDHR